jgi:urease accessory protein
LQVDGERVRIRDDRVVAEMVEGLGGRVSRLAAPFDPEAGAYAAAPGHQHRGADDGHRG